jgi:hypothetical protein
MFWRKKRKEPASVTEARKIAEAMIASGHMGRKILNRVGWYHERTNEYGTAWQNVTFRTHWWKTSGLVLTMIKRPHGWRLDGQAHYFRYFGPGEIDTFTAVLLQDGSYNITAS